MNDPSKNNQNHGTISVYQSSYKAFNCDIESDGTIAIQGVTHTGEKKVHAHGMVFEMQTQNLGPPGDFLVSFELGGDVDPSTLEHVLANGVLEGVVKKKPIQSS